MYGQIFQFRYWSILVLPIEMENNWCQTIRNRRYQLYNPNVVRRWKKQHICIHPDSAWNQSAKRWLSRTASVNINFHWWDFSKWSALAIGPRCHASCKIDGQSSVLPKDIALRATILTYEKRAEMYRWCLPLYCSSLRQCIVHSTVIIIIIIIIKKNWQCKAGRGRLTPYESEDPSPTLPTYIGKEKKGQIVEDKKGESN